ncbi:xanthine dehydrogenase family protein molybdopterin-binding subunit [Rhodococcus opacus]|uniref:xanthine dehydrogenase family protein molybdopterin-binding subunit n=1 Tax=Rhodococcus opacus TaxID=37919 RepID=UPI00295322A5|nr:xanthine dehydrogenase family protein molybdopterin-binding subunit [Rhodococcus opacus]MDV7090188.1 xanthine dehydrogenase family protein molybdopterin-binding subunit [Rhodococcus opacus]
MTIVGSDKIIGEGIDRVEGPHKVTGTAKYPNDYATADLCHAALVQSTIASGRILDIDTRAAESSPGVLLVLTYRNAPRLQRGPMTDLGAAATPPLQDDRVLHYGQHVAVVVAETPEQATAASHLVEVRYETTTPVLDMDDPRSPVVNNPWGMDTQRGDVQTASRSADVMIDATYTTPDNTNNPLGLFSTIADWDGDTLLIRDSTQWPHNVRRQLAATFGIPESGVRALAPYVGGGFGAGLRVWPHTVLTAVAAREIHRPVKLVLTRPQMFTSVGHRPDSVQRIKLGATREGDLTVIEHSSTSSVAMEDDDFEPVASGSATAYACPNVATRDQQRRLNIPCPTSMRGPAQAQGNFALESAIDELAYAVGIDPLDFRLRNYAEENPQLRLPWSSNALRECYIQGAERFGWSRRSAEPRSMREGRWLVGYGMAGVAYPWYQAPCQAQASVRRDGSGYVCSGAIDIGTGTYTVMTQLSADLLGLDIDRVRFDLGDSDMPVSPQAGGSGLTSALGNAVHAACQNLIQAFVGLVRDDPDSPLRGSTVENVTVTDGRIHRVGEPSASETYADILARNSLEELTADGASTPPAQHDLGMALTGAFGAKFVEVQVDTDLGRLKIVRIVSAIDGGRILNRKTATSQIIGGTVGGIGQAMFEETITDADTGRIANATFGDYLVSVNADIPDMDVMFVGEPDRATAIGTKGVGEVGLVGIAAAIANGVFHATGKRIRSLPITLDQLL